MVQMFEIMKVLDLPNHGQFIVARQIDAGQDFELKDGSSLDDIFIHPYLEIPRKLDKDGQLRSDVFMFRPSERFPANHFNEGQIVKLIVPD